MRAVLPDSIGGRTVLLLAVAATCVFVLTTLPVMPARDHAGTSRLVPLDTWAAGYFPAARDFYRARLAVAATPTHLPLVGLSFALVAAAALSSRGRLGAWLARWVPPLSAEGLGLYRIVLGLALFAAWRTIAPPDAVSAELHRSSEWLARLPLVRMMAGSQGAAYWLWEGASVALLLFAAGLWSRLSLVAAAGMATIFVGILLTTKAMHDWGIPLVTLWMLTLVPWRDSAGVQTAWRRWRGQDVRSVPPEQRGLAIWLPGLTIGMAFAAAAFAKLDTSGLDWITSGAVRFHFIEDARQAPVAWGMLLARSDLAAVALSLATIVVEGGFWLVIFVRSLLVRALFGLVGIIMLSGFYFLQGVFWPGWWALFLAFAPWPLTGRVLRDAMDGGAVRLNGLQAAAVVLLAAQQPLVSAMRFESEPFLSDFSMYAYTWPSKEAFDRHLRAKTARLELSADALAPAEFDARLRQVPGAHDTVVEAVEAVVAGEPWSPAVRAGVEAARRGYEARFGQRLSQLQISLLERRFDWDRGDFEAPQLASSGVVDLEAGRFHPRDLTSRTPAP